MDPRSYLRSLANQKLLDDKGTATVRYANTGAISMPAYSTTKINSIPE
jgi:hypothetical protein